MPDFCQPMMTGECTNFCPVFCPADQQLCPGLIDENGKMLGQFFMSMHDINPIRNFFRLWIAWMVHWHGRNLPLSLDEN